MKKIQEIIEKYQLQPHPEGGYYREVYRSGQIVISPVCNKSRNSVTHIYFLLTKGQVSRFHKVLHDEIWNFYEGSPLKFVEYNYSEITESLLGKDTYFKVIPGGVYQAAETSGEYSLVGCTVAPGFDFEDFTFLKNDTAMLNPFLKMFATYNKYI